MDENESFTGKKTKNKSGQSKVKEKNITENSETEEKEGKSKENSYKIGILNFFKYFAFLIPSIIATILYIVSLEGCSGTVAECVLKYNFDSMKLVILLLATSSFLYTFQIYINFHFSLPHLYFTTPVITVIFFLCYIYDTGSDFASHGSYNRIGLFIFIGVFTIVLFILKQMLFYSIKKGFIIFGLVLFLSVNIKIWFDTRIDSSCDDWFTGFKNTIMDNSEDSACIINKPKICYLKAMRGLFDFSGIFGETCKNLKNNSFEKNRPLLNTDVQNAKILGFPKTNDFEIFPNSHVDQIQREVFERVIDYEKATDEEKENIEIIINYKSNSPIVQLNVKRNETLVEMKRELFNPIKDFVLTKNVLYVFIDSLSRIEFKRKLPKFWRWIEKHYRLENSTEQQYEHEAFQFFKLHGTGQYTYQNMLPTLFGVYNFDVGGYHFINHFNDYGYITGQATSHCGKEVFDIEPGAIEDMKWPHYDHELVSLFCDVNFTPPGNKYGIHVGVNRMGIRCLYEKFSTEFSLEYLNKFWEAYHDEAKLFKILIEDGHEGSGEVIQYSDDFLTNFFEKFEEEGKLEDTILYIQCDHGVSMIGPYSSLALEDWKKEIVLPAFYLMLPTPTVPDYEFYRNNLKSAENSVITPFNIHNSFVAILNIENLIADHANFIPEDEYYYDLYNQQVPRSRNCSAFYNSEYYEEQPYHCRCNEP